MGRGYASSTTEQRLALRTRPPGRQPVMFQQWQHLLFLHWAFAPDPIQQTLPPGLRVDTFEGNAHIGIVPFFMNRIRPRGLPPFPWISWFLEINLRTYVVDENGVPGVWFYSLDTNRAPAVLIARKCFHLPYFRASLIGHTKNSRVEIGGHRAGANHLPFEFHYQPNGKTDSAREDSLDCFLVERYLLHSLHPRKGLHTGRVFHSPYPLQRVELTRWNDSLFELNGLSSPDRPPDHQIYSAVVDVDIFGLEPPHKS